MRLSTATLVAVAAAAVLLVLAVTNLVLPADTARLTDTRPWIAARATGVTAYLLLAAQVVAGLVMSHPTNVSTWKQSKRLFPWHEHLAVFAITYILFPLFGLGVAALPFLAPPVAMGMLFLTLLPSTVQSSIAFTAIARGNVAAARIGLDRIGSAKPSLDDVATRLHAVRMRMASLR